MRTVAILFMAFAYALVAIAQVTTVGETAIGTTNSSGNANKVCAQTCVILQTGAIQSISFYVATVGGNVRLGIYDNTGAGGNPGALRAATVQLTPVVGWNTVNVTASVPLSAGTYWLAFTGSNNVLVSRTTGSGQICTVSRSYAALPTSFPTAGLSISTAEHWSLYATLLVGSVAQFHIDSAFYNTSSKRNSWPNPTLSQMEFVYYSRYKEQLKDTVWLIRPKQSLDVLIDGKYFNVKYDTTFGLANKRTTQWIATYPLDTVFYRDTMSLPYTMFGDVLCDGTVPVPSDSVYRGWTTTYHFNWDRVRAPGDTVHIRHELDISPIKLVNANTNIQAQIRVKHYEIPVFKYWNDTTQTIPVGVSRKIVPTGSSVQPPISMVISAGAPAMAKAAIPQQSQVSGMTVEQVAAVRDNPEVLPPNSLFRNATYRRAMGWRPVDEQKVYNNAAMKVYNTGNYLDIPLSQEAQQRKAEESMRKFYEMRAKARDEFLKHQRDAMQDTSRHR